MVVNSYAEEGTALVNLTVTDQVTGCTSTITKEIEVTPENQFYEFANAFSPNGDGVNDYFRMVVPLEYKEVVTQKVFRIYDRWGQLIYEGNDPTGWDGTYQGRQLPPDVYAYYLEIDIENCKTVSGKGNVTLIR